MADPSSSLLEPFTPPPAPPADLVIDTFGTFLGKRSGRLVVRWREPAGRGGAEPDPFSPAAAGPSDGADSPAAAGASGQRAGVVRFPGGSDSPTARDSTSAPGSQSESAGASTGGETAAGEAETAAGETPFDGFRGETETEPEAVAARLLSLWSRPRAKKPPLSRGSSARSAPSPPATLPRSGGEGSSAGDASEASGAPEASGPADRFRRLDASLRDLDAAFDDTPQAAWRHREVPLDRLKSVIVASRGVTISSDLIDSLVERGVQLSFLSSRGTPVAHLNAPALAATVQTRRSQLAAYSTRTGIELAAAFIDGKLRNQRHTLLYFGKYLKASAPDRYRTLVEKAKSLQAMRRQLRDVAGSQPKRAVETALIDVLRDRLMGLEGAAARCYWEGVAVILQGRIAFPGRETRGAIDPVNAALNYGYGILYSQVFGAVVNAGLEPYAGFLHVDRPGKPSLVLDLVEEFRAPVVDRAVLAIVNQGTELASDAHGLVAASRRTVADRVLERLDKPVPFEGKRHRLRNILQMQARHLATAVRGERTYKPFCSRW